MYDSYTYQIYRWLVDNGIAGKIDDVITSINGVIDSVDSVFSAVVLFGLVFVAFKFLNKRWLLT